MTANVRDFLEHSTGEFDLVFVDPPWDLASSNLAMDLIALDRLLPARAEVILSRRHTDTVPKAPPNWRVATDRRYGDTRILRYEKEAEVE